MRKITIFMIAVFVFGCAATAIPVFAAADIYVDKNAGGDSDGSKGHPYKTIEKGIDAAMKNSAGHRVVEIARGTYDENVTVGRSVDLRGAGKNKTVIAGTVALEDNSGLKDLTISTKNPAAIDVAKGASVSLVSIEIAVFGKTGVNLASGNGALKMRGATLHDGGKGIYAQAGNRIEITDSTFYDLAEEAVDVRANVDGFIKGNSITGNRESGIEVIVGSAELVISGNTIKKNRASGVATQFYAGSRKYGTIRIANNKIVDNGKFGLDCNIPLGGNPAEGYWAKSIELRGNTMTGNKEDVIAPRCDVVDAIEQEQKEAARKAEEAARLAVQKKKANALLAQQQAEEAARLAKEQQNALDALQEQYARDAEVAKNAVMALEAQSQWWRWLRGPQPDAVQALFDQIAGQDDYKKALDDLEKNAQDQSIKDAIVRHRKTMEETYALWQQVYNDAMHAPGMWHITQRYTQSSPTAYLQWFVRLWIAL